MSEDKILKVTFTDPGTGEVITEGTIPQKKKKKSVDLIIGVFLMVL